MKRLEFILSVAWKVTLILTAVFMTACSQGVTMEVIDDSQIRCGHLGGLAAVSVDSSRSYWFVKAHCKNGSVISTTIERK